MKVFAQQSLAVRSAALGCVLFGGLIFACRQLLVVADCRKNLAPTIAASSARVNAAISAVRQQPPGDGPKELHTCSLFGQNPGLPWAALHPWG